MLFVSDMNNTVSKTFSVTVSYSNDLNEVLPEQYCMKDNRTESLTESFHCELHRKRALELHKRSLETQC